MLETVNTQQDDRNREIIRQFGRVAKITYYAYARHPQTMRITQLLVTIQPTATDPRLRMRQEWTGVEYKSVAAALRDMKRLNITENGARVERVFA